MSFDIKLFKPAALAACAMTALLSGCSSVDLGPSGSQGASIIDKSTRPGVTEAVKTTVSGLADSGRTHTVVAGDTLYNISARYGLSVKDLMALNSITDPTQLGLGTTLRLPETVTAAQTYTANDNVRIYRMPGADFETDDAKQAAEAKVAQAQKDAQEAAEAKKAEAEAAAAAAAGAAQGKVQEVQQTVSSAVQSVIPGTRMIWPVSGKVSGKDARGIRISGVKGDVVLAALGGTVIYTGNTVDGYGNLVIVKHSSDLITAYGNNDRISVTKGQTVRAGTKLGELGTNAAGVPELIFEVREKGKPVDPLAYLPKK